jgi:hypothetical protein
VEVVVGDAEGAQRRVGRRAAAPVAAEERGADVVEEAAVQAPPLLGLDVETEVVAQVPHHALLERQRVHVGEHVAPPLGEHRRAAGLLRREEGEDVAEDTVGEIAQAVHAGRRCPYCLGGALWVSFGSVIMRTTSRRPLRLARGIFSKDWIHDWLSTLSRLGVTEKLSISAGGGHARGNVPVGRWWPS